MDPLDFDRDLGCGFDQWVETLRPDAAQRVVDRQSAAGFAREWQSRYQSEVQRLAEVLVGAEYWRSVLAGLATLDAGHVSAHGQPLLANPHICPDPSVVHPDNLAELRRCTGSVTWKDVDSVREKLFRKNRMIDFGRSVDPGQEEQPLFTPWTLFDGRICDLVRTTIVVRRFDSVRTVAELLGRAAADIGGVEVASEWRSTMAGYYAHHSDVTVPMKESPAGKLTVEVQVCTQLQDVLRSLTHKIYAVRRCNLDSDTPDWQYDPSSEEFTPNYLGHLLHLADGLIVKAQPL